MECPHLSFDYLKSTQAINYFAKKSGGTIDKLKVVKLIFFADRYHLRKYDRLVTNDSYFAMKLGPVSSGTKDILDANSSFIDQDIIDYSSEYFNREANDVISTQEVDYAVFSKSDIESLDFAWDTFGKYNQINLKDITHYYPEWRKHKPAIDSGVKQIQMNYKDFFEEPDSRFNPCYTLEETEKKINLALLNERAQAKSAWD